MLAQMGFNSVIKPWSKFLSESVFSVTFASSTERSAKSAFPTFFSCSAHFKASSNANSSPSDRLYMWRRQLSPIHLEEPKGGALDIVDGGCELVAGLTGIFTVVLAADEAPIFPSHSSWAQSLLIGI